MNKSYVYEEVFCCKDGMLDEGSPRENTRLDAFEVAGALTTDEIVTGLKGSWGIRPYTQLYIPAYPSECGTGDVASNFRFKEDKELNNIVSKNWMGILREYKEVTKNPVIITAVHRNDRLRSIKMNPDGSVIMIDKKTREEVPYESKLFTDFLLKYNIKGDDLMKIRESSIGSNYYSYLSDMISFLIMVNSKFSPDMFTIKKLMFEEIRPTDLDSEGNKRLNRVIKADGSEWTPIEGHNYLYFKEYSGSDEGGDTNDFLFLKKEYIDSIYDQLWELISTEESKTKELVRRFFSKVTMYLRWSDYWVNDVDDAFTILSIINCYNYSELTDEEQILKEKFTKIAERVFG